MQEEPSATETVSTEVNSSAAVVTFQPMYSESQADETLLARFLPLSSPQFLGICVDFVSLEGFLTYLAGLGWSGYLYISAHESSSAFAKTGYLLIAEGNVIQAFATEKIGNAAFSECQSIYKKGSLSGFAFSSEFVQVLASLSAPFTVGRLAPDIAQHFTGIALEEEGAVYAWRGQVLGVLPLEVPAGYGGRWAFEEAEMLKLMSLGGFGSLPRQLTLRGRDAMNPITETYTAFYAKYGSAGVQLLKALWQGQTPAEYARGDARALADLERVLIDWVKSGYVKEADEG